MDELFVDLLLSDIDLVGHIRNTATKRIESNKATDRAHLQAVIDAAVDETFDALKLKDMLRISRDQIKAKTAKASYGRIDSVSMSQSLNSARRSIPKNNNKKALSSSINSSNKSNRSKASKSIDDLMRTIKPDKFFASLDMRRSSPQALGASYSATDKRSDRYKKLQSSTDSSIRDTQRHNKEKQKKSRSSKSASPSSSCSSGWKTIDREMIEKVGKADAELDAKLLSSPQLKEILSRAKHATTPEISVPMQASVLEEDDDDFLNGDSLKVASNAFEVVASKVRAKSKVGIVGQKIDFGKRQRFDTAFPDFEDDAEFDTVEEWLQARAGFKAEKAQERPSDSSSLAKQPADDSAQIDGSAFLGSSVSDVAVDEAQIAADAADPFDSSSQLESSDFEASSKSPDSFVPRSIVRPKQSEEPEFRGLAGCGPGIYIGSELVIDIDSPPRSKYSSRSHADHDDTGYTDDFEDLAEDHGPSSSRPPRKRVTFPPKVLTDTFFHRSKYTPNEVVSLFYTHDEAHQFQADYSYEIFRAESQGMSWEAWWAARSQEDIDKEEQEEQTRLALIRAQNEEAELEEIEEDDASKNANPFEFG